MPTTPNIPKIKVSRKYKRLSHVELAGSIKGIKFAGDPDATHPVKDDTVMHGLADDILEIIANRVTDNSTTNTLLEKEKVKIALDGMDENANYLENIANAVAKAAGDVNAGYAVVIRICFEVTGKAPNKRKVGFIDSGPGWAHAHEAKTRKGYEGHVWEGGIITVKNTPPEASKCKEVFNLESDIIFNNIPSGSIFAYHHASVAPVNNKSKTPKQATPQSSLAKTQSVMPMNKAKHPIIDFSQDYVYTFGDWRYIVIP
jgi:hypothetical protein